MTAQPVTLDEIYTYITVTLLGGTPSGDNTLGKVLIALGQAIAAGGGGGGWPGVNGTGPGNLTAQTSGADTVGYNLVDEGTGGITLATPNAAGTVGIQLVDSGGGVDIESTNVVSIGNRGPGEIVLETTGGGATTGITIQTQASDTGGITLANVGGPLLMTHLPTANPHVVGALWNNSGVVNISAG